MSCGICHITWPLPGTDLSQQVTHSVSIICANFINKSIITLTVSTLVEGTQETYNY